MASIIKADNIQKVSDGSNIIKKCGSTITLGSCGATIALAAGATQTGFGQTYSAVEYCTTAKTSPFTAAAGTGYFINTTCGAVTVTLPASPTAGDVIAFKDYASQWNTNNVTLCNNGNKINGVCATAKLSTQNQSVSLIYVDATKGWQDIQDSTAGVTGEAFITATGGTIVTCGDYKTHIFTADGCFTVSTLGSATNNKVDYLVIAGGGGASLGTSGAGGAGAGGFRVSNNWGLSAPVMSPLSNPTGISVTAQTYPITVGAGGPIEAPPAAPEPVGVPGSPSVFSSITSTGGGGGGGYPGGAGAPGGSGGGGGNYGPTSVGAPGGTGNTPPVSPSQGNSGGAGRTLGAGPEPNHRQGGGGGGAEAIGESATPSTNGGSGGDGSFIADGFIGPTAPSYGTPGPVSSTRYFAGGGGGGAQNGGPIGGALGGAGGGGAGAGGGPTGGSNGVINTGGGTGGRYGCSHPGTGGSGIVVIRYKFQ
jgi:hypothetical protein